MKIALGQIDIIAGRPDLNYQSALKALEQAQASQADLLLFPANTLTGTNIGNLATESSFLEDCHDYALKLIAASHNLQIILGGFTSSALPSNILYHGKNGELISTYTQPQHQLAITANLTINLVDTLTAATTAPHANITCVLAADTFYLHQKEEQLDYLHQSISNQALLYVNSIGTQNNGKNIFIYEGHSFALNTQQELVALGASFQEELVILDYLEDSQDFHTTTSCYVPPTEIASIYAAIYFGTKEFLQQMGIKKMTIGISGGIDSAVAAALYIKILGAENVLLVNMPSQYNSQITKDLALAMAEALGTNYTIMPIDSGVNNTIEQLTTTSIHSYYRCHDFHLQLTPLATENIQARYRGGTILSALSSAWGGVCSCNANKAELTVGYATFYGDLLGAMAILGDLWKHQVYALGHYMNKYVYAQEVLPPDVFTIPPSAELSSAQTVGTGGDPLNYPYHDYLFHSFLEQEPKLTPYELLQHYAAEDLDSLLGCRPGVVQEYFPTAKSFIDDLERWWQLFTGFAVAKRIQSPPVLTLTKCAYGNHFQEVQRMPYYTQKYLQLKKELLTNG